MERHCAESREQDMVVVKAQGRHIAGGPPKSRLHDGATTMLGGLGLGHDGTAAVLRSLGLGHDRAASMLGVLGLRHD